MAHTARPKVTAPAALVAAEWPQLTAALTLRSDQAGDEDVGLSPGAIIGMVTAELTGPGSTRVWSA
jgi:hypothetical protein